LKFKHLVLSALAVSFSTASFASGGLLNQLDDSTEGKAPAQAAPKHKTKPGSKKSTDPVAAEAKSPLPALTGDAFQKFFVSRARQERLSIDVHQWVELIQENKLDQASYLWTAVEPQLPAKFRHEGQAAQLYTLWKLGLNQVFLEQWTQALADNSYRDSAAELVFEQLSTPNLDSWLLNSGLIVSPKQQTVLGRLPTTRNFVLTLKAWSVLREAKLAEEILHGLPVDNKLVPYLAETAIVDHVKRGELKAAAKIIKNYVEPYIGSTRDMELLAKLDLISARILYQAGQLKAAAEYYSRIPNQTSSYLQAREELSWIYLRLNDTSRLRGEIEAFFAPALRQSFLPETHILRAISDLKMCYYDRMERDLREFMSSNAVWAKRIDEALKADTAPAPASPDFYTKIAETSVKNLEAELSHLNQLTEQSLGAALPAVGQQRHWKDYAAIVQSALAKAKKNQSEEYSRQWKNQRLALAESIRKMRFVKVEFISQVNATENATGEVLEKKAMVASNGNSIPGAVVTKDEGKNMLTFPTDTELWPDEFFKLRSAAQAQCLRKSGVRK